MAAFDEEHQARPDGESLGHAGEYRARRPHSFRADQATTPEAAEVVRHVGHLAVKYTLPRAGFSRYPEVWIQGRQKTRTGP